MAQRKRLYLETKDHRSRNRGRPLTHTTKILCPGKYRPLHQWKFRERAGLSPHKRTIRKFTGKFSAQKPLLKTTQTEPRYLFKKSPSQTTSFKLCHKAYPYRHKNVIIMLLLADVLGGGISSRLSLNVREKLGLVYEIACYPTMFSDVGSLDIYTSTKKKISKRPLRQS